MIRIRWHALRALLCAGAALASSSARAQLVAPDSGVHVRIVRVEEHAPQEGSFVDATSDSVRISPAYGLGVISLPFRSIESIDASSGTHINAGRVLKGAAAGAGIALVATAAITVVACAVDRAGDGPGCGFTPYVRGDLSRSLASSPGRGSARTNASTSGIASMTVGSPPGCTSVQHRAAVSRSA